MLCTSTSVCAQHHIALALASSAAGGFDRLSLCADAWRGVHRTAAHVACLACGSDVQEAGGTRAVPQRREWERAERQAGPMDVRRSGVRGGATEIHLADSCCRRLLWF